MSLEVNPELERAKIFICEGRFDEADLLCKQILSFDSKSQSALLLRAVILARTGDSHASIRLFLRVLEMNPESEPTLNWLCLLFRRVGEPARALEYGQRLLQLHPSHSEGLVNVGTCLLDLWRFEDALQLFDEAASFETSSAIAYHNRAVALQRLGRNQEAIRAFRQAIDSAPTVPASYISLGSLLNLFGKSAEADACFDIAEKVSDPSLNGQLSLAQNLLAEGLIDRAGRVAEQGLQTFPESADLRVVLGEALRFTGNFDSAAEQFGFALANEPSRVELLFEMAYSKKFVRADDYLLTQIEVALRQDAIAPQKVERLHYALGKAKDDLGDFQAAAQQFRLANEAMLRHTTGIPFNHSQLESDYTRIIGTFTSQFVHRNLPEASSSELPILIVGMIRSGTTLIEQILSSHPEVGAGGELPFWLEGRSFIDANNQVISEKASWIASTYDNYLRCLAPGKSRVTDKMPHNFIVLGAIHLLFPNARIIHCRRDPADTCLSIYVTPYRDALNFAHRPEDIVFFYRQYQRLMEHWRAVLPSDRFLEVDYESVIDQRVETVQRLVKFVGLEWNDACLKHEERGGAVLTPSNWQVRQPLYRSSVGRYEHYQQWIPELAKLLASPRSPN